MKEKLDQIGGSVSMAFELLKRLEMPVTPTNVDIMNRVFEGLRAVFTEVQSIKKEVEGDAADSPE